MVDLTQRECAALRGELSVADWKEDVGMALFRKGLAAYDPLLVLTKECEYRLTEQGREVALKLRQKKV